MLMIILYFITIVAGLIVLGYLFRKYFIPGRMCKIVKDMTGKFVIITGASSGLGEFTAIELVKQGAKVIFACRSQERAELSIKKIPKDAKGEGIFEFLDLCDLESIEKFAQKIMSNYPKIDILINNAGAQPIDFIYTKDELESYLEGNHLGPMALTLELMEYFEKDSRIINVSSCSHYYSSLDEDSGDILSKIEKVKDFYYQSEMSRTILYADCKIMNIYFTQYLSEKCEKYYPHIKCVSLHPGPVKTNFARFLDKNESAKKMFEKYGVFLVKTTEQGAQTHLYLSYLPFEKLQPGAYYVDCQTALISKRAKNKKIRDAIIKWSLKEINDRVPSSYLPDFSTENY